MEEQVILVDEHNHAIGVMEKNMAHQLGLLHRAFSIFIFNNKHELLIQQRAFSKYHSAGLWTNTCCSHPRPNETTQQAAERRLQEEMGFSCKLTYRFDFIYKATLNNQLIEHEFDSVYIGKYNYEPLINPKEVAAYKWMAIPDLIKHIKKYPTLYTEWLKIVLQKHLHQLHD
jgi:isopentenyl-diphosphate delta-isomerase